MTRVFNLSGGKSSAYMTILCQPQPDDIVLFTDTGREHPATYQFLADIEMYKALKFIAPLIATKEVPD